MFRLQPKVETDFGAQLRRTFVIALYLTKSEFYDDVLPFSVVLSGQLCSKVVFIPVGIIWVAFFNFKQWI